MKRLTLVLVLAGLGSAAGFAQQLAGGDGAERPERAASSATARSTQPAAADPAVLIQLVSGSPWCGDDGQPVVIVPPTSIPPADLTQGLFDLIYNQQTFSLSDVKRAVRLIGATPDPSAGRYLNQILADVATIVSRRTQSMAQRVRRPEQAQFQAYIASATADLKRVVTESLPPQ